MPAMVWRGGTVSRGLMVGVGAGLFFGFLAWLDSGMLLAAVIVVVILGVGAGIWMPRRMARHWPGSLDLNAAERVQVVQAVRRGTAITDPALAPAVRDYARGLHGAAENGIRWRWLIVLLLLVAVGTTLWDAGNGSLGNTVASAIYLVLLVLEVFWWPKRQAHLLANADQAAALAAQVDVAD